MIPRIPTFVISLARAPERRAAICRHLNSLGISYTLVNAVDGRTLDAEHVQSIVAPGITMHPGAVGCYLSHVIIYEQMRETQIPVALVIEDDARLDPRIKRLLDEGCRCLDFDYCFLDSDDHNDRGPIFYDADSGVRLSTDFTGYRLSAGPQTTHAYLITLEGATKRLQHAFPMHKAIDLYDHLPYPIRFWSMVSPKGAWVGEQSLASFTSNKAASVNNLSLAALRRWPLFYQVRDLIRLKGFRRNHAVPKMIKQGRLPPGKRWRALPSGREILLDG